MTSGPNWLGRAVVVGASETSVTVVVVEVEVGVGLVVEASGAEVEMGEVLPGPGDVLEVFEPVGAAGADGAGDAGSALVVVLDEVSILFCRLVLEV